MLIPLPGYPRKHETLTQCCCNVDQPSVTSAQFHNNIESQVSCLLCVQVCTLQSHNYDHTLYHNMNMNIALRFCTIMAIWPQREARRWDYAHFYFE